MGVVAVAFIAALSGQVLADDKPADKPVAAKPKDKLTVAREHLQRGRYDEAIEAYEEQLKSQPDSSAIVLGLSRADFEQGQHAAALKRVDAFLAKHKDDADVLVRKAELLVAVGQYEDAELAVQAALKLSADHLAGRLVAAQLLVERGQLKEADEAYRWVVRYYNRKQPEDAETLLLVGQGSAVYARWHSVADTFTFIVNTLCEDALKSDPLAWQANHLSGSLLLEKFNRAQGIPDLKAALAINPVAVEVLVALGAAALDKHNLDEAETYTKQALAAVPNSVAALQLQCDLQLTNGAHNEALETIQKAAAINPRDQGTLARLATCYYLIDLKTVAANDVAEADARLGKLIEQLDKIDAVAKTIEKPTRLEQLVIDLAKRNSKPGQFLTTFGDGLSGRRKFAMSERLFVRSIELMPQLGEAKTALGMLYMQTGRTEKAKEVLDAAFKADPYHVRVSNMRKVLGVLGGYKVVTTDHFVIRVDTKADAILAEYMAEYLEEVYVELVKIYGYEPPTRTTFEIYHDSKGLTAHEWFSARMVGLPWIQTIGASTGMMVAMASPTAVKQPYNWARVVKHEFVHIVTLQQTGFNIPHWFTEALAVTSEGLERPAIWNRLLLERVPAGKIAKLDELNHIFVRPETPENWQFAYCQSRLYAQYMIETYGEGVIAKLLDCYRRNLTTSAAIKEVFGISADEFHAGYVKFLEKLVAEMAVATPAKTQTLAELEKAHLADEKDAAKMAAYADGLFKAKRHEDARELAEQAATLNPKEPLAAVVLAELELLGKDTESAASLLEAVFDDKTPHPRVLGLLGKVCLTRGRYDDAVQIFELGRSKFGADRVLMSETDEWSKGLAAAYLKLDEKTKLVTLLESMAKLDGDDATVRKKLAQLAVANEDWVSAKRWALEAIYIDVKDVGMHEALAQAFEQLGDEKRAARERRVVKELSGG